MHAYLKAPGCGFVTFCSKVPYDSRFHARQVLRNLTGKTDGKAHGEGKISVYQCLGCRYWHVGHSNDSKRSR